MKKVGWLVGVVLTVLLAGCDEYGYLIPYGTSEGEEALNAHESDVDEAVVFYEPMTISINYRRYKNEIIIYDETINSFGFLQNHGDIESLTIKNTHIVSFDYLVEYAPRLREVSLRDSYYVLVDVRNGVWEFVEGVLTYDEGLAFPKLKYLENISITTEDPVETLRLFENNTHITGMLFLNATHPLSREECEVCQERGIRFYERINQGLTRQELWGFDEVSLTTFEGLESFRYIEKLIMGGNFHYLDITAVSGMANLRYIRFHWGTGIVKCISPLFELPCLRYISTTIHCLARFSEQFPDEVWRYEWDTT